MSHKIFMVWLAALALGLASNLALANEELRIISWPGFHPPEIVSQFEREHGVKIRIETFSSSEEMIARMTSGSRADIIMPREYAVDDLIKAGVIAPLDHNKIPNLKAIGDLHFNNPIDPGCFYSAPYMTASVGLMYRHKLIKDFMLPWDYFYSPHSNAAPFIMPLSYREVFGSAMQYLGYSYDSQSPKELDEAVDLLTSTVSRPSFMGFQEYGHVKDLFSRHIIHSALSYNNEAAVMMQHDPSLAFVNPSQGHIMLCMFYVINEKSEHKDLAHKWINFVTDPKISAKIARLTRTSMANEAAVDFYPVEIRNNKVINPGREFWENAHVPRSLGPMTENYQGAWARLKGM